MGFNILKIDLIQLNLPLRKVVVEFWKNSVSASPS